MDTKFLLEYAMIVEFLMASGALVVIWRKRLLREFYWLASLLGVMVTEEFFSIPTMFFRKELGIPKHLDYQIYFCAGWICFFLERALLLLVIYSVFRLAMKPLRGLHRMGQIVFRWVGLVAIILATGVAIGPHVAGFSYLATVSAQVQQGISVLTLCLLLFVCFAIRHLGLTYRSHIFGVSLGLGILATGSLVQSAWLTTGGARSPYSPIYLFGTLGTCATLVVWTTYFAMPEPKRKMVLLPTTSPFFLWNRVSEALGDQPGFVAVSGFSPDMLAPAELHVLTAASKIARERQRREAAAELQQAQQDASQQVHVMAMQR